MTEPGPSGASMFLLLVILVILAGVAWAMLSGDSPWGPTGNG